MMRVERISGEKEPVLDICMYDTICVVDILA